MTIREEIDAQFPIRKTTAQKRAFEKWVMAKMREMGYRPYVDGMNRKDKLRHRNIVAGDPQNAELLISAHYDTGVFLLVTDLSNIGGNKTPKDVTYDNAMWIGICQGISVFPGISRCISSHRARCCWECC